jgi:hypothetical protein
LSALDDARRHPRSEIRDHVTHLRHGLGQELQTPVGMHRGLYGLVLLALQGSPGSPYPTPVLVQGLQLALHRLVAGDDLVAGIGHRHEVDEAAAHAADDG